MNIIFVLCLATLAVQGTLIKQKLQKPILAQVKSESPFCLGYGDGKTVTPVVTEKVVEPVVTEPVVTEPISKISFF